jgi:hypothetical protein
LHLQNKIYCLLTKLQVMYLYIINGMNVRYTLIMVPGCMLLRAFRQEERVSIYTDHHTYVLRTVSIVVCTRIMLCGGYIALGQTRQYTTLLVALGGTTMSTQVPPVHRYVMYCMYAYVRTAYCVDIAVGLATTVIVYCVVFLHVFWIHLPVVLFCRARDYPLSIYYSRDFGFTCVLSPTINPVRYYNWN